jgi:hypothetical protein
MLPGAWWPAKRDFKKVGDGYAIIRAQCEAKSKLVSGPWATEVSLHKASLKAGGAKPRPASTWGASRVIPSRALVQAVRPAAAASETRVQ